MNIKQGLPPNIEEIRKTVQPGPNAVFTYGKELYIQDNDEKDIGPHLLEHEETHTRQQGDDPDQWWQRYLSDPQFRLEQEVEAYGNQYAWIKKNIPGVKNQKNILFILARDLSGGMYGDIVSFLDAESMIRLSPKAIKE